MKLTNEQKTKLAQNLVPLEQELDQLFDKITAPEIQQLDMERYGNLSHLISRIKVALRTGPGSELAADDIPSHYYQ